MAVFDFDLPFFQRLAMVNSTPPLFVVSLSHRGGLGRMGRVAAPARRVVKRLMSAATMLPRPTRPDDRGWKSTVQVQGSAFAPSFTDWLRSLHRRLGNQQQPGYHRVWRPTAQQFFGTSAARDTAARHRPLAGQRMVGNRPATVLRSGCQRRSRSRRLRWCCPMSPPAPTVWAEVPIPPTVATATRSPTAPTVGHALASSRCCPTTAPTPPCASSSCVRSGGIRRSARPPLPCSAERACPVCAGVIKRAGAGAGGWRERSDGAAADALLAGQIVAVGGIGWVSFDGGCGEHRRHRTKLRERKTAAG